MARGKKTSPEVIYQVMAVWSITDNILETARRLDMPEPTVRGIVLANKDKEEFKKLRDKNREEFSDTATRIIGKAMKRLEDTIDNEEEYIPVNQLTTAIGTLYDKRALARGESTQNIDFATNCDINKLIDIAGYRKKGDDD